MHQRATACIAHRPASKTSYCVAIAGLFALDLLVGSPTAQAEFDLSGYFGFEQRAFWDSPLDKPQESYPTTLSIDPEWYTSWNDGDDSLIFKPQLRWDSVDEERSAFDLRELFWLHAGNAWEFGAGVGKVFWGVTESQHLVDIVNQTDLVASPDGEEKLGQPMVRFTLIRPWGVTDLFALPGFRERTFPGLDGRLRSMIPIDTDEERFQSGDKEKHIDLALRWSHAIGGLDLGLSAFHGTSRDPDVEIFQEGGKEKLRPVYPLIDQFGVDAQYTVDSWLLKLEMIYRDSDTDNFSALTGGFEYTFVGIMDRAWDLGVILEYSWDQRHWSTAGALQNDLFFGGRWALNDVASSEVLFGIVQDLDDSGGTNALVEASTRIGDRIKVYFEVRLFGSEEPRDPFYQIRRDSYAELSLEYYF